MSAKIPEFTYDRSYFYNAGTELVPSWVAIGDGIASFNESLNAKTVALQFIPDSTETTITTGYAPKVAYEAKLISDDAFNKKLYDIGVKQLLGQQVEIVAVDTWEDGVTAGYFTARKYAYNINPSETTVATGEFVSYTGELSQDGSVVLGEFDVDTLTFLATASAVTISGNVSTFATGAVPKSIIITVSKDTFLAAAETLSNWTISAGTTALSLAAATKINATQCILTFTGTAAAGTITMIPKVAALTGGVAPATAVSITVA